MIIKDAAEMTGISINNLRYYERIGLFPPVPRTESGIRDYDERSLHWIDFAMKFKKAGVPLEAIIEYIRLAMEGEHTKDARREILAEVRDNAVRKVEEMQKLLDIIQYKMENYYNECLPETDNIVREYKKE